MYETKQCLAVPGLSGPQSSGFQQRSRSLPMGSVNGDGWVCRCRAEVGSRRCAGPRGAAGFVPLHGWVQGEQVLLVGCVLS